MCVAPQQPVCAVGVGAVIGGGDVQEAGSRAGGQLGVELAAAVRCVGEVVADVLCGVGDADGDVVIGEEPRAGDEVFGRRANDRRRGLIGRGISQRGAPIGS